MNKHDTVDFKPFQKALRQKGFFRTVNYRGSKDNCRMQTYELTFTDGLVMNVMVQLWGDGRSRVSRAVEYTYRSHTGEKCKGLSEYERPICFDSVEQMREAIAFIRVFPPARRGRFGAVNEMEAMKMALAFQTKFQQTETLL